MKNVHMIIGTRPDAIKMAPIYHALRNNENVSVTLISTGQHKELLASVLRSFQIQPDIDLKLMRPGQPLTKLTSKMIRALGNIFQAEQPDLVLNHGDTATCYAAALASFYQNIPFYHVEAGLRSNNVYSPFPEEFHRRSITSIASHHFAPSAIEKQNLISESISANNITITGNTIHDAIRSVDYNNDNVFKLFDKKEFSKLIVITMHRREMHINNLLPVMRAIKNIAIQQKHFLFIFPVHPNPEIKMQANKVLGKTNNILLTAPFDYPNFLGLLSRADLILTDSGGVQEEASYFGRNVFIMREHTERLDGVKEGHTKVVGMDADIIEREVNNYLHTPQPATLQSFDTYVPQTSASSIIADFVGNG